MKSIKVVYYLNILLILITISSQIRLGTKNSGYLQNQAENKSKSGNKMKMIVINGILARDVGAGIMDSTWICGLDGRVYRYDPMNVVHNILNQPPKCYRIDVDYEGLPWIITTGHKIWRLMHEFSENFRWVEVEGKNYLIKRMWN